jgi:hypothetical protein
VTVILLVMAVLMVGFDGGSGFRDGGHGGF